jgi:hypothetical protein
VSFDSFSWLFLTAERLMAGLSGSFGDGFGRSWTESMLAISIFGYTETRCVTCGAAFVLMLSTGNRIALCCFGLPGRSQVFSFGSGVKFTSTRLALPFGVGSFVYLAGDFERVRVCVCFFPVTYDALSELFISDLAG